MRKVKRVDLEKREIEYSAGEVVHASSNPVKGYCQDCGKDQVGLWYGIYDFYCSVCLGHTID